MLNRDFQRQMHEVKKAYNNENNKRKRLSCDNEQLQWMLKQRVEEIHILEAKLTNSHDSSSSNVFSRSQIFNDSSISNCSPVKESDVSPPLSPVMKGLIKKTESVSWVLVDENAEASSVSKSIKRAGSFRAVDRNGCTTRRQLSLSATASMGGSGSNCSMNDSIGPNPLSQSMSAASVIRQHSNNDLTPEGTPQHKGLCRTRSKSVSIKATDATTVPNKKYARQSSANGTSTPTSPYTGMRPRTSTMKSKQVKTIQNEQNDVHVQDLGEEEELFTRSSSSKLITCDASTLNKGEKLHNLPTHSSLHDLKVHNCQEIQESAGEAMVSGTNSEDEGCSAYSDEIVSSSSSSNNTQSGSSCSLNQLKNANMSFDDIPLMEGSWSEDNEAYVQVNASESQA